jgi:hypothetical protein
MRFSAQPALNLNFSSDTLLNLKQQAMRQPTKNKLRADISELRTELMRCICQLPEGDLKKRLAAKFPDYYIMPMIDKYGGNSFLEIMEEIGKQPHIPGCKFNWFES